MCDYNLQGIVRTVSNFFRCNPRIFFIELCCNDKTLCIVAQEEQKSWLRVLRRNSTFCFDHLVKKNCNFQVIKIFQPLALYQLDSSLCLSMTFADSCENMTFLQEGQEFIVLDGHLIQQCLFVCGRSRVIMRDSYSVIPPVKEKLPLISLVAKYDFSFQDVLWLMKQHGTFERKFCDNFLQVAGVLLILCSGLRERVLTKALRLVLSPPAATRSILEEFLVHSQCSLDRPVTFSKSFYTLEDVVGARPDVDSQEQWWYSCVERTQHLPEMPVVVYLDTCDGQWMLRDSTMSIPCVLTSLEHPSDMLPFVGNFITFTKFHMIWECFKTATTVVYYTCMVVSSKDLRLVFNMQKKLAEHLSACVYCGRANNVSHVCLRLGSREHGDVAKDSASSVKGAVARMKVCDGAPLNTSSCPDESGCKSITVRVLHKSTVRLFKLETMEPQCHVLVMLLSFRNMEEEGLHMKLYYLQLNGRLVMQLPLLDTNAVYTLSWPVNSNFLAKQQTTNDLGNLKLADNIVLPENTSFYHTQVFHNWNEFYSVSESLRECLANEMLDLEGIVINRSHKNSMFVKWLQVPLEKGYGVPKSKTIVLRLKDVSCESEANVYLTKWNSRKYPIGLLPGSYVRLTMILKKVTGNGVYFVTTPLTRVEILAVNQSWSATGDADWGDSCLLLHTPLLNQLVWGTVVLSKLLKVSFKVVCNNCASVLQSNACGFMGCHKKFQVVTTALLTAIVEDAYGKAILIVKDRLVQQVFRFSEEQWQALHKLSMQDGELLYLFKEKVQTSLPQTLGQEVFKLYCSVVAQRKNILLHVRCRKYPPDSNNEFNLNLPVLYCVDIRYYKPVKTMPKQLND